MAHGFDNVLPMVKTSVFTGRTEVEKAHTVDHEVPQSAVIAPEDENAFADAGALVPPYNAEMLCGLFEVSNSLRPNVDAYATNIDAFGHRFDPIIDLSKKDADQKIADAILMEKLHAMDGEDLAGVEMPSKTEISERKKLIELEMRLELSKLTNFFDFCCLDESFTQLRRKSRQDREVIGYGFWEVLRNDAGMPAQFTYLPAFTVRLTPLDKVFTEVDAQQRITPLTFDTVKMQRRFRRFVQVFGTQKRYFKEYGDPRTVSSTTGWAYTTDEAFEAAKEHGGREMPDTQAATEVMYFPIHNPQSSYGVPRWIGAFLSVIGSRQAEEVNFLYFDNKSVPPLAILVSGGSLSDDSANRIRDFLTNEVKGRRNFHSVLVLEAESPGTKSLAENTGRVKIEMRPLTAAQHNDALFQKYDERNIDKVGMAFRLPRMLRGDIRDFNRSTADAALNFAEMQVFQPEREEFDFIINRKLLTALGIKYWRFVSNAPVSRNPEVMSNIIRNLANAGVIWPELGIQLAQDVFNKSFAMPDGDWIKQPIQLTVAQVPVDSPLDADHFGPTAGLSAGAEGEGGDEPAGDDDDIEVEVEETDEKADKADLSGADLAVAGGKQPAQGTGRRKRPRLLRLKPKEAVKMVLAIQKGLQEHQATLAEDAFKDAMSQVDDDDDPSS